MRIVIAKASGEQSEFRCAAVEMSAKAQNKWFQQREGEIYARVAIYFIFLRRGNHSHHS